MADREDEQPIFVVGPARSGTTMLRGCLNAHPEVFVGNETHYFDDLRLRMAGRETRPLAPAEATACEAYFMGLLHGTYAKVPRGSGAPSPDRADAPLTVDELRATARQCGEGADAYFEAFCRLQARAFGGRHWGEKTPRHVFRIREIVDRYPDGKVICMVRDPRAVVASYRNFADLARPGRWFDTNAETAKQEAARIRASYHPLIATILWRAAARASLRAAAAFGEDRVIVQRFEDFVAEPEPALRRLCDWLDLDYRREMIDTMHVANSSFGGKVRGVSAEPARRWRTQLSRGEIAVIQMGCGDALCELGYEREDVGSQLGAISSACLSFPFAVLRAYGVNRRRIADAPGYVGRRLRMAFATGRG